MTVCTSDFVEAFECKRCGAVISNSDNLPERYNEQKTNEEIGVKKHPKDKVRNPYRKGRPVIQEPGRFEAHTSILEHSREVHDGDFIDMYQKVEVKP
jgi:hypothetical protein